MSSTRWHTPIARSLRHLSISAPRSSPSTPTIPYTWTCPSPTCSCAPAPQDLDIDRKTPLLNTMPAHSQHLLICTGNSDWTSRIEDEPTPSGAFIRGLKSIIGKGGPAFDPFTHTLISTSSLPANPDPSLTDILLLPSFKRISNLQSNTPTLSNLASAHLKPRTLHPFHASLSPAQKSLLTRDESAAALLPPPTDVDRVTILICGHASRDSRCGVLGPILQHEFERHLHRAGVKGYVALISHIGGHKFAGNVIVYLPPGHGGELAGSGVWYGRVGPGEVEGVVEETVVGGRVVGELFRGGMMGDGRGMGGLVEEEIRKERGEEEGGLRLRPRARG
ncbi:hypothetical protein EJ04DRAFT_502512 [Polyplosphaeria fusca]|uniref:Altered inheritance of mitochondria protein 32 n=1 Tax=Polyplosphaeria fusca TaxID=682080 RepID=A0A9P4UYL1_9PLEO|nr:hypothetical protein EJ04DRAFT_502512 [Polyplosphaeria fusca]